MDTTIIIPHVNLGKVWGCVNSPILPLWIPEHKLKIQVNDVQFDKYMVDAQNTTNKVQTKCDQFDVKCVQCPGKENCKHFLDADIGCFWCRQKCPQERIGIPIGQEHKESITVLYLYGRYCSYNCALADLREKIGLSINQQPYFIRSEAMLKQLFYVQYKETKLLPAPHWTLLDKNGGELSSEQFNQERFSYCHTNKYFRVGVSMEFLRKINGK